MCQEWIKGECKRSPHKCRYAHGEDDLQCPGVLHQTNSGPTLFDSFIGESNPTIFDSFDSYPFEKREFQFTLEEFPALGVM